MDVEMIFSEDAQKTFEIKRTWDATLKKAIIIELYPTAHEDNILKSDMSTLHLLNHAQELGIGEVRMINIYSTIYHRKPLAGQLTTDHENLSYICTILDDEKIKEYDIIIAWGNSMSEHKPTKNAKLKILKKLKEQGLDKQVQHITTSTLDNPQAGTHSLYLGLRHSKEKWNLSPYPLDDVIKELAERAEDKGEKGDKRDVLQNKKRA